MNPISMLGAVKTKKHKLVLVSHYQIRCWETFASVILPKEIWKTICDVFEKHTLLNELTARRRFYTAQMHEYEGVLAFVNRTRQLSATLKSMKAAIDDEEMAIGMLNGLPERLIRS